MRKEDFLKFVPEKYKAGKMSDHAAAAATIRAILKAEGIAAKVTSKSYAGGDNVSIGLADADPYESRLVVNIHGFFEYGTFDGYTDCYDHKKSDQMISGLPTAKYVLMEFNYSEEMKEKAFNFIKECFAEGTPEDELRQYSYRLLRADVHEIEREGRARDFWLPILESKKAEKSKTVTPAPAVSSEKGAENCEFIETDKFFQVKFSAKPAAEVLETLKRNDFKWFRAFGYWGTFKNGRTADQMRAAIGL